MKNLFIYHPGTGTVISLSDEVYVCDTADISAAYYGMMLDGASVPISEHKGVPIDNYNMTNFLEG